MEAFSSLSCLFSIGLSPPYSSAYKVKSVIFYKEKGYVFVRNMLWKSPYGFWRTKGVFLAVLLVLMGHHGNIRGVSIFEQKRSSLNNIMTHESRGISFCFFLVEKKLSLIWYWFLKTSSSAFTVHMKADSDAGSSPHRYLPPHVTFSKKPREGLRVLQALKKTSYDPETLRFRHCWARPLLAPVNGAPQPVLPTQDPLPFYTSHELWRSR